MAKKLRIHTLDSASMAAVLLMSLGEEAASEVLRWVDRIVNEGIRSIICLMHPNEIRHYALLDLGAQQLHRAERSFTPSAAALLAALYALRGDLEECRRWSRVAGLAGNVDFVKLRDFLRGRPPGIYWRPAVRSVADRLRTLAGN